MKLRFTPRSLNNLSDIADYLRVHNPQAATRVRSTIYAALQFLISFPHLGRRQAVEGVRKIVTRRYAYLVYYLVDETADEIVILSVKHPAQAREHADL